MEHYFSDWLDELISSHETSGACSNEDLFEPIIYSIKNLRETVENSIVFNESYITYINSAFSKLSQLNICPLGFSIESHKIESNEFDESINILDSNTTWIDMIKEDIKQTSDAHGCAIFTLLLNIKSYISNEVWLRFDPPTNSAMTELIKEQIKEDEWHILLVSDNNDIINEQYEGWKKMNAII